MYLHTAMFHTLRETYSSSAIM